VVAVVLALACAGCSASGGSDGDEQRSTTTEDIARDEQAFLAALALDRSDVRRGEEAELIDGGDEVAGQVTLDFCGAAFATESHRLARHQEAILDGTGEYVGGTEAVRYEPGQAARAVDEMRDAIASCDPDELSDSTVGGVPAMRILSEPIDDSLLPDVADDHVAIVATASMEDGTQQQGSLIYQRRGDVLIGSYDPGNDRAVELANAAGRRLAAVPADQIGG